MTSPSWTKRHLAGLSASWTKRHLAGLSAAALEWIRREPEGLDFEYPRLEGRRVLFRNEDALRNWMESPGFAHERSALLGKVDASLVADGRALPWSVRLQCWTGEGITLPFLLEEDHLQLGLKVHPELNGHTLGLSARLIGWNLKPSLPQGYVHTFAGELEAVSPQEIFLWRERGVAHSNLAHRIIWHSPSGFDWGYKGSGPAELALNLLAAADPCPESEQLCEWDLRREYGIDRLEILLEEGGGDEILSRLDAAYDRLDQRTGSLGVQLRPLRGPHTDPGFYRGHLKEDKPPQGWVRKRTQLLYQIFKDEFIAPLPLEGGHFQLEAIRTWLEARAPLVPVSP